MLQALATAEGSASQDADRDDRSTRVGRLTRQKVQTRVAHDYPVLCVPLCYLCRSLVGGNRPFVWRPSKSETRAFACCQVRVSRKRILESAAKVMELYADSRSVLELEFFGEVRTGGCTHAVCSIQAAALAAYRSGPKVAD